MRSITPQKVVGDGGDGGRGGSVVIRVSLHLYDLSKFKGNKKFIAANGGRGNGSNKKGKDADDLIIGVPYGTRVICAKEVIVDLVGDKLEFVICRGGMGGKGNYKRNYTMPPQEAQDKHVILDYRIPNDVAIVGFPNSGKTSLFNALTNQKQKVAEYPFTTTSCFWSKAEHEFESFTVLDTPPLKQRKDPDKRIEAVFLKHLLRSKVMLFLSDNACGCKNDFVSLADEISLYDSSFIKNKKVFYLLSKSDKIDKGAYPQGVRMIAEGDSAAVNRLKKDIMTILGKKREA